MRVRFSFEGGETEVVVPDARLAADVAALFPQGRIEAAEGEADRRAEGRRRDEVLTEAEGGVGAGLRVVPGTDGFVLLTGEGRATFDSLPDLLAAVEFAVVNDLLAQDDLSTHLHAAGAITPFGAVLVSGPSGAGKSSLALAWSLAGHTLLGDDVVRLDREGLLGPFPRLLKVDPTLLAQHGLAPEDTPAWDPESDEAWFDPTTAGGWAQAGSRAAVVARIEYGARHGMRVREEEAGVGLRILLDAVQATGLRTEESMDRFIGLLEGVRVFDVRFGSSRDAARVIAELAQEPGALPMPDPAPGTEP